MQATTAPSPLLAVKNELVKAEPVELQQTQAAEYRLHWLCQSVYASLSLSQSFSPLASLAAEDTQQLPPLLAQPVAASAGIQEFAFPDTQLEQETFAEADAAPETAAQESMQAKSPPTPVPAQAKTPATPVQAKSPQTPVQAPAQAESPPTPIQAQAKSPATPLQAIVQQTSPPKQAPPTPSAAGTPNSQTSNQSTPGTSTEVSLLQAKINELEKQLAAKAAPPKEVPCQTPQNRIRSKGHPSPAPTSAREAAPAPAADANTAEDLDEEEEDEQEGQSKIMVTSPDGTIES
eukprot:s4180_g2.t1